MAKRTSRSMSKTLTDVAKKLAKSKRMRKGTIALRLTGKRGGDFCLSCTPGHVPALLEESSVGPHLIEIIGDAGRIESILAGRKNARKQFLAGGIRIRGDIRYLSDLAMDLGILDEPI